MFKRQNKKNFIFGDAPKKVYHDGKLLCNSATVYLEKDFLVVCYKNPHPVKAIYKDMLVECDESTVKLKSKNICKKCGDKL